MGKPEKESDWKKIGPCLYRYKEGAYYGVVKIRGKQIRRKLGLDLAKARRDLVDLRRDLERTDPALASRTMADNGERFLRPLPTDGKTATNTRRSIARLVGEWPGPKVIRKVKRSDCVMWLAQYPHLKPASVNKLIQDARDFFALAVEDGVIPRSPMEGIKYRKRGEVIRLTPTGAQFNAIVADLRGQLANGHGREDTADFVELAGTLGLGQGELTGILRQHIDLKGGTIKIMRRKTKRGFTIPLYPRARPIIERRLACMGPEPEARLLPQDDCKGALAAACRRLGFPKFEPRALRRYFITQALRAGVDVPTVAAWQGHRDGGALILRTYGDEVRLDHSQAMAKKMA